MFMAVFFGMKTTPVFCQGNSQPQPYVYFKNPDSTIFSKKTKPSFFRRITVSVTNGITKFLFTSDPATLETADKVWQEMSAPLVFRQDVYGFEKEIKIKFDLTNPEYWYTPYGIPFTFK